MVTEFSKTLFVAEHFCLDSLPCISCTALCQGCIVSAVEWQIAGLLPASPLRGWTGSPLWANRDFVLNYDDTEYGQRKQIPQSNRMYALLPDQTYFPASLGNDYKKSWSTAATCNVTAAEWSKKWKMPHASVWWANKQRQRSPGDIKK